MMNGIKYFILLLIFIISQDISSYYKKREVPTIEKLQELIQVQEKLNVNEKFIQALAERESSSNPDTVNTIGAMGMFQFMPSTIVCLGYDFTLEEFIKDPSIFPEHEQRKALDKKIKLDIQILEKQWFRDKYSNINYIKKYVGKKIKGTTITLAGILGACHLSGAGGVIRYFDSGISPKDLYGTGLEDYLLEFSSYEYHNPEKLNKILECTKVKKDPGLLIHLQKQLKLYCVEEVWKDMETLSTLKFHRTLMLSGNIQDIYLKSHLALKCNCLNTTEQCFTYEAVPHSTMGCQYQMALAKLNGTIQTSGAYLFKNPQWLSLKREVAYVSSTLNQCGMLLGGLNCHTFLQTSNLLKLNYYLHPEEVLERVVDRRRYRNLII